MGWLIIPRFIGFNWAAMVIYFIMMFFMLMMILL